MSPLRQIVMHVLCMARDHKWSWHAAGLVRAWHQELEFLHGKMGGKL
jgi:hypothetical protein